MTPATAAEVGSADETYVCPNSNQHAAPLDFNLYLEEPQPLN